MEFQQLKCFKAVIAAQSYSAAAENLGLCRTGVRLSIKELENSLSTTLFRSDSVGNNFVLTESGRILSRYADDILALQSEAIHAVQNTDGTSRSIRLVHNDGLIHTLLPRLCDSYHMTRQGKNVTFLFTLRHHPESICDMLIHDQADLGFSYQEIAGVRSFPVAKEQLYVLLPDTHPLHDRKRIRLYELKDMPLILPSFSFLSEQTGSTQSPLGMIIQNMLDAEHIRPVISNFSGNVGARIAYVGAGLGYTIAPVLPQFEDRLVSIEIDNPFSTRPVYMHWPTNRELSLETIRLRDYCIDLYKSRHDMVIR